ncbi:MAG: pentapeptide repeat-containing protein [Nitrospinaceae bacterium]|nr:pentapeptide repeat-containing protein [Nitrospinaceae bacterium]
MRILIVFGLVGLLFGCGGEGEESASELGGNVGGQTTKVKKNIMKLKATGSCVKCTLTGADLSGANLQGANLFAADLSGANLQGANLKRINLKDVANLDDAILCRTIMSWGEENKDCK